MSNLQKFNQNLDNLEKEINNLRQSSEIIKKIGNLVSEYEKINETIKNNNAIFSNISKYHKEERENIQNFLTKTDETILKIKEEFLLLMNENSKKLETQLIDIDQNRKNYQNELSKNIESNIEHLTAENKKFYKDLDDDLRIKLDNHKSEIQRLIENERNQIKQIFEIEFSKAVRDISATVKKESEYITDYQSKTRMIAIGFFIIIIIISLVAMFR